VSDGRCGGPRLGQFGGSGVGSSYEWLTMSGVVTGVLLDWVGALGEWCEIAASAGASSQ